MNNGHVSVRKLSKVKLYNGDVNTNDLTWNHMELSVMLEHVQAHVALTDIDPGAGLQGLPNIHRSSPKSKAYWGSTWKSVYVMQYALSLHQTQIRNNKFKGAHEDALSSCLFFHPWGCVFELGKVVESWEKWWVRWRKAGKWSSGVKTVDGKNGYWCYSAPFKMGGR
nr:protein SABRE [Tanacetum cinerariifolium]